MAILKVMNNGKEVTVYAASTTIQERTMSLRAFDEKIKNDYRKALGITTSRHVCSYFYKGCVFAWESLARNVEVDQNFALSLDLPALKAAMQGEAIASLAS